MTKEEEQTTQWPKEKVQKDKQRSTKHTHKTKEANKYDHQIENVSNSSSCENSILSN